MCDDRVEASVPRVTKSDFEGVCEHNIMEE